MLTPFRTLSILTVLIFLQSCATSPENTDKDIFKQIFGKDLTQMTDEFWNQLVKPNKVPQTSTSSSPEQVKYSMDLSQNPYFGISPFPYDYTLEAVQKVAALTRDHSTIFAMQLDHGIPWKEALEKKPWPRKFQNDDWDSQRKNLPQDKPRYVSVAPLKDDRKTLAYPGAGSSYPAGFESLPLNDQRIKEAYLYYIRRVIQDFQPDYLNIGQEAGDIALHAPEKWPQFAELYEFVRSNIKREFPSIKIGISYNLPFLMQPDVSKRVKSTIEKSDYVGISFYAYMTQFYEKMRGHAIGEGPQAWRDSLEWLKHYTSKPIAICETAYASEPITLSQFQLSLSGDPALQKMYVEELVQRARKEKYLFVVWFAVIDYDKLYEKFIKNNEAAKMWMKSGFFDQNLQAKPAWEIWTREVK